MPIIKHNGSLYKTQHLDARSVHRSLLHTKMHHLRLWFLKWKSKMLSTKSTQLNHGCFFFSWMTLFFSYKIPESQCSDLKNCQNANVSVSMLSVAHCDSFMFELSKSVQLCRDSFLVDSAGTGRAEMDTEKEKSCQQ